MAAIIPDSSPYVPSERDVPLRLSLISIERLLDQAPESRFDRQIAERLAEELHRLHVKLRQNRAVKRLTDPEAAEPTPPEYADARKRLDEEHPQLLGQLDRLIRAVDTIADQTLEDQEVFLLRGRELVATLRRHEAEEDRWFYLAVWRDTGGES